MWKYTYPLVKSKIKNWIKYYIYKQGTKAKYILSEIITTLLPKTLNNTAPNQKFKIFELNGNTIQNGEPTPDNPQEIQVVTGENVVKAQNKNLINVASTFTFTRYQLVEFENMLDTGKYMLSFENWQNSDITKTSSNAVIVYQDNTLSSGITLSNNYKTTIINASKRIKAIRFYSNSAGITTTLTNLQLEKGETATSYVPHEEQNYTISLGNIKLCKTRSYSPSVYNQDYIYGTPDNWYIHNAHSEIKLQQGDPNIGFAYFQEAGTDNSLVRMRIMIYDGFVPSNFTYHYHNLCYSENFATTSSNSDISTYPIAQITQNDNRLCIFLYLTKNMLGITSEDTTEQMKTKYLNWINANKPEFLYPLKNTEEIPITDTTLIQQLNDLANIFTYDEITDILFDGNLSPYVTMQYYMKGE